MSDSVQPHRRQPTRLPRPWDSPGNNTGVGCRFLLQCMKVKNESEVAQSCLTLKGLLTVKENVTDSVWAQLQGKFRSLEVNRAICLLATRSFSKGVRKTSVWYHFWCYQQTSVRACCFPSCTGFAGGSERKNICPRCGRPGINPWVREIPLEKGMASHSIHAWGIPWTEELGGLQLDATE